MANTHEPKGEDFLGDPQLTQADLKAISEIFTHYKATGKIPTSSKAKALQRIRIKKKKNSGSGGKSKA